MSVSTARDGGGGRPAASKGGAAGPTPPGAGAARPLRPTSRPTAVVGMLLVYMFWLLTTPYHRFQILDTLHFQRWIVAGLAITWMVSRSHQAGYHRVAVALGVLVLAMLLSYMLSDHKNDILAVTWAEEYWKELVIFVFIGYGIYRLDQLALFLIGIAFISLGYQSYSLLDFIGGGSYVYQQGLRRMVGVWSGGGIGSANEWGSFALYSLPLAVFWYRAAWNRRHKCGAVALLIVSVVSVLFSGTRAAFVVSALYGVFELRKQIFRPTRLVLLATLFVVAWTQLPQQYRARIELIWHSGDTEYMTRTERVAIKSGMARIMGLEDGWELFLERPLLGYGPGASTLARGKFHPDTPTNELEQLHNLYGQVLSELGALGTLSFIAFVLAVLRATWLRSSNADVASAPEAAFTQCIRSLTVLLLLYGGFTHSLYQFYWPLVGGLATAFAGATRANGSSRQVTGPGARRARAPRPEPGLP